MTIVHQEKLAVGALAVRVLLRRVAHRTDGRGGAPKAPKVHVVPTRLIVRESCGAGLAAALERSGTIGEPESS
jgi:DNA-binding LacI/PurR family transcriptional regulator